MASTPITAEEQLAQMARALEDQKEVTAHMHNEPCTIDIPNGTFYCNRCRIGFASKDDVKAHFFGLRHQGRGCCLHGRCDPRLRWDDHSSCWWVPEANWRETDNCTWFCVVCGLPHEEPQQLKDHFFGIDGHPGCRDTLLAPEHRSHPEVDWHGDHRCPTRDRPSLSQEMERNQLIVPLVARLIWSSYADYNGSATIQIIDTTVTVRRQWLAQKPSARQTNTTGFDRVGILAFDVLEASYRTACLQGQQSSMGPATAGVNTPHPLDSLLLSRWPLFNVPFTYYINLVEVLLVHTNYTETTRLTIETLQAWVEKHCAGSDPAKSLKQSKGMRNNLINSYSIIDEHLHAHPDQEPTITMEFRMVITALNGSRCGAAIGKWEVEFSRLTGIPSVRSSADEGSKSEESAAEGLKRKTVGGNDLERDKSRDDGVEDKNVAGDEVEMTVVGPAVSKRARRARDGATVSQAVPQTAALAVTRPKRVTEAERLKEHRFNPNGPVVKSPGDSERSKRRKASGEAAAQAAKAL